MSVKEKLIRIIDDLPEERIEQIIDFAEFLDKKTSKEGNRKFGNPGGLSKEDLKYLNDIASKVHEQEEY